MNYENEIKNLHAKGFVILRASRATNAPVGWKTITNGKTKWGYSAEMADANLAKYRSSFSASVLARSHCGFYLGHGNLCCIDLDTKKVDIQTTEKLKNAIVKKIGASIVVERTKSNGFHIYFLYNERLSNEPDFMGKGKANWIELYYSKRFIACYLSNSKKYTLEHGEINKLISLTAAQHAVLLGVLAPYRGKKQTSTKKVKQYEVDQYTWDQAESYVQQIESQQLDITGDNPTWFKIGKGFANAFGTKGLDMFTRLSQFSATFNADTIGDVYKTFVDGDTMQRDKRITIATFFKMCDEAGLHTIETLQTLKFHPVQDVSEFELILTKKERMPEHVHTLVMAFKSHVEICCTDIATFFVFEHTHWQRRNKSQVIDIINMFVDRSNVEDKYRKLLRTVPYLDMAIRELQLTTMRDALTPNTGDLHTGIFINLENGVLHIDIKTGKRKLLDHESKYNFTTLLPFAYEQTATSPKFDKWINNQIPNKDLHAVYFAFVGSCLTKHRADIIMLLVGETSTGKSSLIDITRRIIGIDNSVAISAGILFGGTPEAQTTAMMMENKLLAYDFDSQPFKSLEMLLKVAAQEPIQGWQMHVSRRPVTNYGRVLVAMNPYSYSVFNPAVARRLITINMDVRVEKDNAIMPAIYEQELAGIFNHVLNVGIKHLLANNGQIKQTAAMRQATVDFHTREKESVRWFHAHYIVPIAPSNTSTKEDYLAKLRKANPGKELQFATITMLYPLWRAYLEDVEGLHTSRIPLRKHFAADLKLIGIEDLSIRVNGEKTSGFYVINRG